MPVSTRPTTPQKTLLDLLAVKIVMWKIFLKLKITDYRVLQNNSSTALNRETVAVRRG